MDPYMDPNMMMDPALQPGGYGMQQVGTSIGGQFGLDPNGPFMRAMSHFPRASATAGWNALRGSNTLLRGGFRESLGGSHWSQRLVNHMHPRAFSRFSSVDAFAGQPGEKGMKHAPYSVFNFLALTGNNQLSKQVRNEILGKGSRQGLGMADRLMRNGMLNPTEARSVIEGNNVEFFSPGFGSRVMTSARLRGIDSSTAKGANTIATAMENFGRIDSRVTKLFGDMTPTGKQASNIGLLARGSVSEYAGGYVAGLRGIDPAVSSRIIKGFGDKELGGLGMRYLAGSRTAAAHLGYGGMHVGERMTLGSYVKGIGTAYRGEGVSVLADRAMGASGARLVGNGTLLASELGEEGAQAVIRTGAEKIAAKEVGGRVAAELAEKGGVKIASKFATAGAVTAASGPLAPVVGAAMTAWMVYDLSKMAIDVGLPAAKQLTKDAYKSVQGTWNKPVMGMGYKDNTVAATSRQRGVMAIQNSRLNARSVLGAEAGMLAAHFG